jgi:hypothetical protein
MALVAPLVVGSAAASYAQPGPWTPLIVPHIAGYVRFGDAVSLIGGLRAILVPLSDHTLSISVVERCGSASVRESDWHNTCDPHETCVRAGGTQPNSDKPSGSSAGHRHAIVPQSCPYPKWHQWVGLRRCRKRRMQGSPNPRERR